MKQENLLDDNQEIIINTDSPQSHESKHSKSKEINGGLFEYFNETFENSFNSLYILFNICIYLGCISILGLFGCLLINSISPISYYLITTFAILICLFSILITNIYLKMKGLIDSQKQTTMNIGSVVTYICLNIIEMMILAYTILLIIKLNHNSVSMGNIAIPLYISFSFAIVYLIFICPALFSFRLYADFILYFLLSVCSITFIILLNNKIDDNNGNWIDVYIPALIFMVYFNIYYITTYIYSVDKSKDMKNMVKFLLNMSSYILITISGQLYFLKLNKSIQMKEYVIFSLCLISSFLFVFDKLFFKCFFDYEESAGENGGSSENHYEDLKMDDN